MTVQKAIFPGLFFGICLFFGVIGLLSAKPIKEGFAQSGNTSVQAAGKGDPNANNSTDCAISNLYPHSIRQWCSTIERYAAQNGLDPNLVSAVMLQESGGQADIFSKNGAVGLLQVMPRDGKAADFMCPAGPCFADRPSSQELLDPEFNIAYGTKMLAQLVDRYGDIRDALKAYGPKDVGYYYADIILSILNSHK